MTKWLTEILRIVNRFAKELDLIDKILPIQLYQYINSVFTLLGVLASMAFASPYFVIAIAAVVVCYYVFQMYFRKSYVETQRMEALSRAPIFSQLGETMRGAATIRAYKMEEVFKNVNYFNTDANSKQRVAQRYLLSWFGLVLDGIGTVLVLVLMILIVSLRVSGVGELQGGFAGTIQKKLIFDELGADMFFICSFCSGQHSGFDTNFEFVGAKRGRN